MKHTPQNIQRRLVDLIDYVGHMARLGDKPVLTLGDYRRLVCHEAMLSGRTGIQLDLAEEDGAVWLSIERLKPGDPPPPPEELRPWLLVGPNPGTEPALADTSLEIIPKSKVKALVEQGALEEDDVRPAPEDAEATGKKKVQLSEVTFRRENLPAIEAKIQDYLEKAWRPWSEEEKVRRGTIKVYDDFFSLLQSVQTLDGADGVEVVWGIGVARWRTDEREIDHPILEQLIDIDMDAETSRIKLRPRSSEPQVCLKPFFALDKPGTDRVLTIAKEFLDSQPGDQEVSPFDPNSYEPLLREVSSRLDGRGRYQGDDRDDPADRSLAPMAETLTVSDTWVVYARQRSEDFFIHDLDSLKAAAERTDEIPGPALRLVSEPSGRTTYTSSLINLAKATFARSAQPEAQSGAANDADSDGEIPADEFLFPKAFNDAQMSIIRRLDESDGVVVQGPPGTGKTHTIANIICHYLATGQRVLVTSKGEAALTVLRDHIPEGIRDLTISLLTNENEGLQQLEQAVGILAEMATAANPQELERSIHEDQNRIITLREQTAEIDRELSEWASRHLTMVADGGEADDDEADAAAMVLPMDLARRTIAKHDQHGWLPDTPDPDAEFDPKFDDDDITALRAARLRIGDKLDNLGRRLPTFDELPDMAEMTAVHDDLVNAKVLKKKAKDKAAATMSMTAEDAIERVTRLLEGVEKIIQLFEEMDAEPWLLPLLETWQEHGVEAKQTALFNDMLPTLQGLIERRRAVLAYAAVLPEAADTDQKFYDAVQRAARGEKALKMFSGGKAELRTLLDSVKVEGRQPRNADDWVKVLETIDWRIDLISLISRWHVLSEDYGLPQLDADIIKAGRHLSMIYDLVERIIQVLNTYKTNVEDEIAELIPYGMKAGEILRSRRTAEEAADAIRLNLSASRFASSRDRLDKLIETLAECEGPIVEAMSAFVAKSIGNPDIERRAISEGWRRLHEQLGALAEIEQEMATVARVTEAMERSDAPRWAEALRTDPAIEEEDDRWTPANWRDAWEWRRQQSYLRKIDGRERIAELNEQRVAYEDEIRQTFHRVVENRTFLGLRQSITEEIESALAGFATAIRRIGKGTGVRARRFRRDAQAAMEKCYAAVPCWIMPTWRISESLPAELGSFDLVVVDEASQSDIGALPALLRGARVLIVGDDKQVSPTGAFLEENRLLQLERNFLGDQPFASMMLPGNSLYELANAIYPGRRIMLREHFRCVEPIIRFSGQFYNEPILPLRIPTASERLEPPLVDVYLPHGKKDGHQVNKVEADAIVDEIDRIVRDPEMSGRSIGVISLIGTKQSDYIQRELLKRIGEAAFVGHDIACGNAATFQGKERDIMFISMVECNKTSSAKTNLLWEQRFNVAFSRARDRMYLYRSVAEENLSPNDLKGKAVLHFKQPMDVPLVVGDPIELCDTDFERDVFERLRSDGYRVVPKVKVSSYAIDLVVEGFGDRRLALSLDGDREQTPEGWADALGQQRTLERLGWRFWRCWGSSFYADPDACLADLKETLAELEIEPQEGELRPSVYTEHRVIEVDGSAVDVTAETVADSAAPGSAAEGDDEMGEIGAMVAGSGEAGINDDIIEAGDRVLVAFTDQAGRQRTITIGQDTANGGEAGEPLPEALLGKSIDDQVDLDTDGGTEMATIVSIDKRALTPDAAAAPE